MREVQYIIEHKMDYEVLQAIFETFSDIECYLDKAFFCSRTTYPVYIPEITSKWKLKFVFSEDITEEEANEFIEVLSIVDTEE